jgi:hypothetical protein
MSNYQNFLVAGVLIIIYFLVMPLNNVFSWHQDLGIDNSRAAELYKTNPNDPQIKLWQDAMMYEIISPTKNVCFEESPFGTTQSQMDINNCLTVIKNIILPNCNSHPNSLLACEVQRIEKYL